MLSPHAALRSDCPIERMLYWTGEAAHFGTLAEEAVRYAIAHDDANTLAPFWTRLAASSAERAFAWRTRVVALPHGQSR